VRLLGRGVVNPEVRKRLKPNSRIGGWMHDMDRPAICSECGRLFDLGDPEQVSEIGIISPLKHTIEKRCIDCANRTICSTGAKHTEIIDGDSTGHFQMNLTQMDRFPRLPIGRWPPHQVGVCSRCHQPFVWSVKKVKWVEWEG
jgi:hypothetical protein